MVLKKQTVWLLTMLSLIIVLSVYYMTSPGQTNDDFAYVEEEEMTEAENEASEASGDAETIINIEEASEIDYTSGAAEETETGVISSISSEDLFTSIRLDREVTRGKMLEQYTNIIASSDAGAELQAQALENRDKLLTLEQKESMLETLIRAKGYQDVLVITDQNEKEVKIIVQADELSREQANEILLMANEQLGEKTVAVGFQPGN